MKQYKKLKFGFIFLVCFSFLSCGGLQSVRKLEKIKPPEEIQRVDIQIQTRPTVVVPQQVRPIVEAKKEASRAKEVSKKVQSARKSGKKITVEKIEPKPESVFESKNALNRKKWYAKANPFRVGEKVTYALSWFAVKAGELSLEVHPHVYVNNRKAYHFVARAKTSAMMNLIHSVDDWIESYVDAETFYPYKSALHGVETDRLREGRTIFDYATKKVFYWMKRVHVKKGIKETKRTDDFIPGMLDVFSSAFFLRVQPLKVGKSFHSLVYNGGKRITVEAKVLSRGPFSTSVGEFDAFHIRPIAKFQGILKTSGDSSIWVSADDRRLILGLESKIKIGYLKARIKKIEDPEYIAPEDRKEE